jgi:uncharacterized protein with von Willebrand factor type A (vWA) domain
MTQKETISNGMTSSIISFIHRLRNEGLRAGVEETLNAFTIANTDLFENKNRFKIALRALCCCSQDELNLFDEIFDDYWKEKRKHVESFRKIINPMGTIQQKSSLVMMGAGKSSGYESDAKNVSGANATERLRKTDFTKVSEIESNLLDELARRLFKEMSYRIRRRLRKSAVAKQIDFRKTFRRNIEKGGTPFQLLYKGPHIQKDKLVLFLDVSSSMDKYSFFLLRFIFSLKEHFKDPEVFVFSTYLLRISKILQRKGIDTTIKALNKQADLWSGGTKIGECFQTFNNEFSRYISKSNSVVIVVSDGLDTGEPSMLEKELQKIKLRSKKIIWLNPLKGMKDYLPIARGMHAALPMIDKLSSAHNLESLMKLEKFLIDA